MQQISDHIEIHTDDAIIRKIVLGDKAMFEVLIRRYNSVLYKIARSFGFNHQDAEDLMQDTHVVAFMELKKFEGRAAYKTWISRIMINKCLYKLKYGYFKNEIPNEHPEDPNAHPLHSSAISSQTEDAVTMHEIASVVEKSLQTIPVIYRTVFVLREVEGFSVAETSDLLNITSTNVKVRLNRAKSMLRKEIEQYYSRSDLYSFNLIYCDALVKRVFEKINQLHPQ